MRFRAAASSNVQTYIMLIFLELSVNSADDDVYGMETMIVILFNTLIAQLSTTYIQAMKVDRLEYDVDRLFQLTRICTERFLFWYVRNWAC